MLIVILITYLLSLANVPIAVTLLSEFWAHKVLTLIAILLFG